MTFSFTTWPFISPKENHQILKCCKYGLIAYALNNNAVIFAEEFGHYTPLLTWAPFEHNITAMAWYDASMTLNTAVPVLLLASESGRLEVFDVRSRKPISRFKIDKNPSTTIPVFNPTINGMGTVPSNSGKRENDYIASLVWSPFSSCSFFAGTKNGRLIRFDISLGQIVKCEIIWEICFNFEIHHISIEPQFGQVCAVASRNGSIATITQFDSNQKDKFPIASPDIIKLTKETDKIEEIRFYPTSEDFLIIVTSSSSMLYSIEESCTASLLNIPNIKRLKILHSSGNLALIVKSDVVELWKLSGTDSNRLSEAKMGGHPKFLGHDDIYVADFNSDKLMIVTAGMWLTTIECKFGSKLFVTQRVKLLDVKPQSFHFANGALIFATKDGRILVTESPNSSLAMEMSFPTKKRSKSSKKQPIGNESNDEFHKVDENPDNSSKILAPNDASQVDDSTQFEPLNIPQHQLVQHNYEQSSANHQPYNESLTDDAGTTEKQAEALNSVESNNETQINNEQPIIDTKEKSPSIENNTKQVLFSVDQHDNSSFASSESDFNKSSPILTKSPLDIFQNSSTESFSSPIKTTNITLTDSSDPLLKPFDSSHHIRGSPNGTKKFLHLNDSSSNLLTDENKKKNRTRKSILKSCASFSSLSLDLPDRELPEYQEILDQSIVHESKLSPRSMNSLVEDQKQDEISSKRSIISTINQNLQQIQKNRRISSITNDHLKQSSVLAQIVKQGITHKSKETPETMNDLRLIQQDLGDFPSFHAVPSLPNPLTPLSSQETVPNSSSEALISDNSPIKGESSSPIRGKSDSPLKDENPPLVKDQSNSSLDGQNTSHELDKPEPFPTTNSKSLTEKIDMPRSISETNALKSSQNTNSSKPLPKLNSTQAKTKLILPQQDPAISNRCVVSTKVLPKFNYGTNSTIIWNYQVTNKPIDEVQWVSMSRAVFYTLAKRVKSPESSKESQKNSQHPEESSDTGFSGYRGLSFVYFINFHNHSLIRLFDKPNINITALTFSPNKGYFLVTINGIFVYLYRNKLNPQQIKVFQGKGIVFSTFYNSRVCIIDHTGSFIISARLEKNKESTLKMFQKKLKLKKEYGLITCLQGRKTGVILGTSTGYLLTMDLNSSTTSFQLNEYYQMKSPIMEFKAGPSHSVLVKDQRGFMLTITEDGDRYQLPMDISYAILTSSTQLLIHKQKAQYLEVYQTIGTFQPAYPTCAARCPLLMPQSRWMNSLLKQDSIDRDILINYGMVYLATLIDARNTPNFQFEQMTFLRNLIMDVSKLWKVAFRFSIFLREFDVAHNILTLATMNQYADNTDKNFKPDKDWAMSMMKSSLFVENDILNEAQVNSILFASSNLIKHQYVDDGVDMLLIAGLWVDAVHQLIEIGKIKEAAGIVRLYRDEETLDIVSQVAKLMPATPQMMSYTFVMLSESGLISEIVQELENMGQSFEAKILTMLEQMD